MSSVKQDVIDIVNGREPRGPSNLVELHADEFVAQLPKGLSADAVEITPKVLSIAYTTSNGHVEGMRSEKVSLSKIGDLNFYQGAKAILPHCPFPGCDESRGTAVHSKAISPVTDVTDHSSAFAQGGEVAPGACYLVGENPYEFGSFDCRDVLPRSKDPQFDPEPQADGSSVVTLVGCGGAEGVCDGMCPDGTCIHPEPYAQAADPTDTCSGVAGKPYVRFKMSKYGNSRIEPVDIDDRLIAPGAAIRWLGLQLSNCLRVTL